MDKFVKRILLIVFSLLLIVFLSGCISKSEEFIQGYWYRGDVHFMDQWYFDRGYFKHETSIFTGSDTLFGRYQVLDYQDDSLILEFDNTDMSYGDGRPQIVVKLDWEADTISIRGQIFERILP